MSFNLKKKHFYLKLLHRCVLVFNFGNKTKGETNVIASLNLISCQIERENI